MKIYFFMSLECLTFTIYQSIMNMNRMNLAQLVAYFNSENLKATADFFAGCANDSVTVDGLIEEGFVKRHVVYFGFGSRIQESRWKDVQSRVTTYIGCTA